MKIFKLLDKMKLFGFGIYNFSIYSMIKEYSLVVLYKIVLLHPFRFVRGLLGYRRFSVKHRYDKSYHLINKLNLQTFKENFRKEPKYSLVATSYCQKPIKNQNQDGCPVERFSSDCLYMDKYFYYSRNKDNIPPDCKRCFIRRIADMSNKNGNAVYIMTSAKKIAEDIFVPKLENRLKQQNMIFTLCPYSVLPFSLPLFVAEIDFIIYQFCKNDCDSWERWSKADYGDKPEQTELSKSSVKELNSFFDLDVEHPKGRFEKLNSVYYPVYGE